MISARRRTHHGFLAIAACAMLGGFGCIDVHDAGPTVLVVEPRHDHRAPKISAIQVVEPRSTTAQVGWATDEYSDSALYLYATEPPSEGLTPTVKYFPDPLLQHWISLPDLTPATMYYFYVISRDYGENTAVSDIQTFQTPLNNPTPKPL